MLPTRARSPHQQAILDFVRSGVGHGVVMATAGSGKTFTLREVASSLPPDLDAQYLAFNAHVARDVSQFLPAHVPATTIHALGLKALKDAWPATRRGDVSRTKLRDLVRAHLDATGCTTQRRAERAEAEGYLLALLHFARVNLTGTTLTGTRHAGAVRELALRYNLTPPEDPGLESACLEAVPRLLRQDIEQVEDGVFDFDDMVYVPVVKKLPVPQADFVLIDEAQDLSRLQLEFALRTVRPGGRQLYVGDPRQSINGFAGADADAMARIALRTQATVFPLPVTFRCPRRHVALAKKLAPEIEPAPGAPEGRVFVIPDAALTRWVRPGDLLICRYRAPLVALCLEVIRAGKPAAVQGQDLGRPFIELARRVFRGGLQRWSDALQTHLRGERARLRQARDPEAAAARFEQHRDLADSLGHLTRAAVGEGVRDLPALEAYLEAFFRADERTITFSTVHGAKGREADRVFLLYPHLMPAVYARTPEAVVGEACLQFVALTRSKRDLIFVEPAERRDSDMLRRPG
ncbi:UvrD-helicase domain-containing protein [Deinococcus yunweiensis]|uniref:UvrD-helicase domain-containing protein n=1 Tax=Deinococcus yunweiensis TaxID=367282 RepID=UPI00398F025C